MFSLSLNSVISLNNLVYYTLYSLFKEIVLDLMVNMFLLSQNQLITNYTYYVVH